jgi:hypothetical protein
MFPNFNLNFKRNITSNESGGNKSPEKEILTEDDVRNRLKELEDYKKGIVKFKDLSSGTKKFLNSFGINNLDKEIEKLQKECEVFDEANRRYTSLEPLFKEKEELENKIKSLESEYSRLDEEYERRDKAGGGAHAEEIGMEMSLIDNQIKELKEKLELINKEL